MTTQEFTVVLRGYDRGQVDAAIAESAAAIESQEPARVAAAKDALRRTSFGVRWWGYDRQQVDVLIQAHLRALDEPGSPVPVMLKPQPVSLDLPFDVALRGYDRVPVDRLMALIDGALAERDPAMAAAARRAIDGAAFGVALRGYAMDQVDLYLAKSRKELAEIG